MSYIMNNINFNQKNIKKLPRRDWLRAEILIKAEKDKQKTEQKAKSKKIKKTKKSNNLRSMNTNCKSNLVNLFSLLNNNKSKPKPKKYTPITTANTKNKKCSFCVVA